MRKFLIVLLPVLAAFQADAQGAKYDEYVNAYFRNQNFNGAVLVARKGEILYEKGFGFSDAEGKKMNDAQSVFQIGSVTKQFTAAIIMQLQQEKKLSVQDPLDKYIKGFPNGNRITIENLLTHTSGLYNYTNDTILMKSDVTRHYSKDEMLAIFKKYPADFEPGSKWNYSNTAYSLLGYIIQQVTGRPYEQEVRTRIFQPLGMTHSGFDFTNLRDGHKTKGYFQIAGNSVLPSPIVDSTIAYSAGSMYSTLEDLLKWERSISSNQLLKEESWKKIFTPFMNHYGYGWGIDSLYGTGYMAHSGGIHGYSSYIIRFPNEEVVVIAMDNSSSGALSRMSKGLAAIALGKPYTVPEVHTAIQVAPEILKTYVGEYELAPNFTITISLEGNQLKAQGTGQPSTEIYAEKENLFYVKVVAAKFEFVRDAQGKVSEVILYQGGGEHHGKKIK
jgi:CubicO group peptidase (beta-lactamase class C family)